MSHLLVELMPIRDQEEPVERDLVFVSDFTLIGNLGMRYGSLLSFL